MFSAILLVLPVLVAVFVVIFVTKVGDPVAQFNGNEVFAGVALTVETLVGLNQLSESAGQRILEVLISELRQVGWDTADESLRDHQDTPFIVQAFKNCEVTLNV